MIGNNKRDLEMDGKKKKPLLLLLLLFFPKDNTLLKSRSQSIKGGSLNVVENLSTIYKHPNNGPNS